MPVNFGLTDEHVMLGDTLRRFCADENDFESRAHRLGTETPDRMTLWRPLIELGMVAALLPEARGGFGGEPFDMAVVQQALAPSLPVEPVLATGVIATRLLLASADPRAADLLDAIGSGDAVVILAHAEGFDPFARARLAASESDDGFMLTGFKPAVRHADVATHLLVTAAIDGRDTLFVVPTDAAGLRRTACRLIDAAGAADLAIDAVHAKPPLSFDNLPAAIEDALLWGLAGLAVETAALIAETNRATCDYLNVRQQFGSKLADFQALQHKVADMAIAGEEAAAMAHLALARLPDRDAAAILRASLACDAAGRFAGHTAVQLFGGMGVSDELIVSHYARRLTAIRSQIGTQDVRAARLSAIEGNG